VALLGCACAERSGIRDRTSTQTAPLGSAAPASVGPEFNLGQPLQPAAAIYQTGHVLATNSAAVSLVVWAVGDNADIHGARVTIDGQILDPNGIPIGAGPLEDVTPAVATDGSGWFVAWAGKRANGNYSIFGSRVTSDGQVLDPSGILISTGEVESVAPSVAFGGTNFFVGWFSNGPGGPRGTRIDASGRVLDPTGLGLSAGLPPTVTPPTYEGGGIVQASSWVAFDDTHYLAVFVTQASPTTSSEIWGSRLSLEGSGGNIWRISDGTGIKSFPSVNCRAAQCFVGWATTGSTTGARVSDGVTLDPSGIVIGSASHGRPLIGWGGVNWIAGWTTSIGSPNTFEVVRISVAGALLDPTPIPIATDVDWFALGPSPIGPFSSRALVTWAGRTAATGATQASFVENGVPSASFVLSQPLLDSPGTSPAAASSNDNSLVVWEDSRDPANRTIYGTRVSPTGTVLDPEGVLVSFEDSLAFGPQVASDGTNWLVTWTERRHGENFNIYGARVAGSGQLLDAAPILIASSDDNQFEPQVAFNGTSWLVTWGSFSNFPNAATRVARDGTVLDSTGIALAVPTSTYRGAIAGGGGQWLAVGTLLEESHLGLYGQRIANDGTVLDPIPFRIAVSAEGSPQDPHAAYGGGQWLVAWDFSSETDTTWTVLGARVDASGAILDTSPIAFTDLGAGSRPLVAHDGKDWLVAWHDGRAWLTNAGDVYGARVTAAGEVAEPNGFAIAAASGDERLAALAAGSGRWLSVYRMSDGPNAGIRARIIQNTCIPAGETDVTCDGIDDDCDGTPDDDFVPAPTTCGVGACASVGVTSCVNGQVLDSCVSDPTDTDHDEVPDCADACPTVPGTRADGCPETGEGGAGGEGGVNGEGGIGEAGAPIVGGGGSGGTGATAGHGGTSVAGHGGTSTAGEAGEAGEAGAAGTTGGIGGHAGAGNQPPPSDGGGCSCGVPAKRNSMPWGLGLGLVGLALTRRLSSRGSTRGRGGSPEAATGDRSLTS
jgi:hypothetical protein